MTTRLSRRVVLVLGSLLFAAGLGAQAPQITFPAASPESTLKQRVGLTDIEVVYSRPGVKGRKIFGGLEPFGSVWRTGANTATKVVFSTPVKFGGQNVAAGIYALYSIPDPKEWTVILSKVPGEWGAYNYNPANDAVRVKAKPATLDEAVETFTIEIGDIKTESATFSLNWEKTRVPVKIEVDTVRQVVSQIETVMKSGAQLPAGTYFSAAMFYHDNGLDLKQARAWVEEATKGDKAPFYMLHGKAKILAKLGDKAGATAAARQSIAAAEGPTKAEYTRLNEALIASLK
jgi:hypothetical protein